MKKYVDPNNMIDNRKFTRVRYSVTFYCLKTGDIDSEMLSISPVLKMDSTDISVGGIGVLHKEFIEPGKMLEIEIPIEQATYILTCQVKYCYEENKEYRIGLEYLEPDKSFMNVLKSLVTKLSLMGQTIK